MSVLNPMITILMCFYFGSY